MIGLDWRVIAMRAEAEWCKSRLRFLNRAIWRLGNKRIRCVMCGRKGCAAEMTRWGDLFYCPSCVGFSLGSGKPEPVTPQHRRASHARSN